MNQPLVITMGDPAGIGPEIIAKAFRDVPEQMRGAFVAGDVATLRRAADIVQGGSQVSLPVAEIERPADALRAPPRCIPVLQAVPRLAPVPFGQVSALAGQAAGDCVFWAARAALRGEVSAIVTAPLHKEALAAAGAPYARYPGHTELLQAVAAEHLGVPVAELPVRMMLANGELRTVLASIHVSLRDAIESVTTSNILQTLRITHQSVGATLQKPVRIAVAGLNPHAGEGGLFGREEIEAIAPAVAQARAEGIDARGPFAPDTVFMRARGFVEFDVVVAMHHDQGLIPVKYLGVEQGVNVTLGLPFVRTSPDHGTAFDIAGTGRAAALSLLAAVRMARQLCQ
ncbi:4-hydroxythreonine-4-phosphate dehydrogenase PdxA [Ottowia testudinis]|uniref:4-hydroxythreonine-4-phosphate dehydrogenase PdxA n=1 Tax=Ottowia testudinis TaxID=2816950 RepID=A0A975H499_9BURK|nr:4-hydroxythreonine-4-phosphate dehydrogenase PdxA [Ottowia testudinis]QTD46096.1 4-hydroxythreonine-4-phosphate dehydrogenase PdxA [Ottowia testudinis]